MSWSNYQRPIENEFDLIDKHGNKRSFALNLAQADFLKHGTGRDVILKARQLGFSSLILAILTTDFIFKENQRCVVVSHETDATQRLMDRVKFYLASFEQRNGIKIPMKYNSRSEIVNELTNSTFYIGTAESKSFGRGDTITNLHLSEFAFYSNPEAILAGVLQAVIPEGKVFVETTANGFNFFKTFWDETRRGERPFKDHFYNPTWEYSTEFLEQKRGELGRLFKQEYPMTPEEAFLTSGDTFFDPESLAIYLNKAREPIGEGVAYV